MFVTPLYAPEEYSSLVIVITCLRVRQLTRLNGKRFRMSVYDLAQQLDTAGIRFHIVPTAFENITKETMMQGNYSVYQKSVANSWYEVLSLRFS